MTLSRHPPKLVRGIIAAVTVASCTGGPDPTSDTETWVTEPDFEIGDAFGGPAAFAQVSDVRVSADGERVFVLEPYLARVSVWTPEGDLRGGHREAGRRPR